MKPAATDRPTAEQSSADLPPPDGGQHRPLAAYALHDADSAGRKHTEPPRPFGGPFERDRDAIVHCSAFRRLSNKTQVFTGELGDYHRTRLTHTLEVSGVARTLARALRLNEDLTEALALAHDLGHPPFGHAGEDTLNQCLAAVGGFNHNRHGLRLVEELEQRSPDYPGLNLSLEVLAGQQARSDRNAGHGSPPLEVQVVDAADSVAYSTHDADDALELGLLRLDEMLELPLWQAVRCRVRQRWTNLAGKELQRALLRELIAWQVTDLYENSRLRIAAAGVDSLTAVRSAPRIVEASPELAGLRRQLEQFLYDRVYRHPQVLEMRGRAQAKLAEMFDRLIQRPELLPDGFRSRLQRHDLRQTVGDFLAGMTDRYAQQQHQRLCRPSD